MMALFMRALLWLLIGFLILPVWAQANKGELTPDIVITDTLENDTHCYQLPQNVTPVVTLQIELDAEDDEANSSLYRYLLAANQAIIEPLAQNFTDNRLIQAYQLPNTAPFMFCIEGFGAYTLLLIEGDALQTAMGDILPPADVRGRLEAHSDHVYGLDSIDNDVITLELINNRRSVKMQLWDEDGRVILPVTRRWLTDSLMQVYELTLTQKYRIRVSGIGDYRLRVVAEDLLREFVKNAIEVGEAIAGQAIAGRSSIYQLTAIESTMMSVTVDGIVDGIIVRDRDNQRVNEQKHFRGAGSYAAVFALTNRFPYQIEILAQGNYTLMVTEGDISRVPEQSLSANDVFYANLPLGRTPAYSVDIAENTELLVTLVLYGGSIYATNLFIISADAIVTEAVFLPLSTNRLRLSVVPQGEPPYLFVPGITGAHVISVVTTGVMPEKSVRIRLTTDSTNLRSGATIDAPILREAATGTELLAVARNTNGDWLLALTGDGLMVWVFRQLVEVVTLDADLSALPFAPRMTPPDPTATPSLPPTMTPTITPPPAVITLSTTITSAMTETPLATFTPTPMPDIICTVSSGGGVNIRFGPGVNYETAGSLTAGQIRGVIGQAMDDEGNIWWQLADSTWVRSDLVQEIGDCTTAPRIEIAE